MKNSEKAFEEWFFSMPINKGKTKEHSDYACENSVWNKSWSQAIELAAKVCEKIEQETWAKYKEEGCNPHQEGKSDGAGVCANEIRKQGAE